MAAIDAIPQRALMHLHAAAFALTPGAASDTTDLLKQWTGMLANWVEIIAAVIIAIAVVEATFGAGWVFVRRSDSPESKESLRLRLGRWLAVALEFELAADILRTAIAPTWNEIGLLAAVAAIRTALNYFLEKEIAREAQHIVPRPTGRSTNAFRWWRRDAPADRREQPQRDNEGAGEPTPA